MKIGHSFAFVGRNVTTTPAQISTAPSTKDGVMTSCRSSTPMTADTSGSYCTLEPVGSERLGATYEGAQAEEGYTFYRLDFQVTNEGDETRYMDNYYGIYFNEDNGNYNDVLDWWHTEEEESQPRYLFEDYDYTPQAVPEPTRW